MTLFRAAKEATRDTLLVLGFIFVCGTMVYLAFTGFMFVAEHIRIPEKYVAPLIGLGAFAATVWVLSFMMHKKS